MGLGVIFKDNRLNPAESFSFLDSVQHFFNRFVEKQRVFHSITGENPCLPYPLPKPCNSPDHNDLAIFEKSECRTGQKVLTLAFVRVYLAIPLVKLDQVKMPWFVWNEFYVFLELPFSWAFSVQLVFPQMRLGLKFFRRHQ